MKLICGKCRTEQEMEKRVITKDVYTLWCPNCNDQISPSCCKSIEDKK